jgi:hypothetical protein
MFYVAFIDWPTTQLGLYLIFREFRFTRSLLNIFLVSPSFLLFFLLYKHTQINIYNTEWVVSVLLLILYEIRQLLGI